MGVGSDCDCDCDCDATVGADVGTGKATDEVRMSVCISMMSSL